MPRVKLKPSPPSCGDAMPTNMVGGNVAQAGGLTSPYPADQTAKYMAALPKSMTQQQKMLSICWQEK